MKIDGQPPEDPQMQTGFEFVAAKPKKQADFDSAPHTAPMKPVGPIRRQPDGDERKIKRQINMGNRQASHGGVDEGPWGSDFDRVTKALEEGGWIHTEADGFQWVDQDAPADLVRLYTELSQMGYANGFMASHRTAGGEGGPWKSGEGDYPFADEVYDLTHSPEPEEWDDADIDDRDFDEDEDGGDDDYDANGVYQGPTRGESRYIESSRKTAKDTYEESIVSPGSWRRNGGVSVTGPDDTSPVYQGRSDPDSPCPHCYVGGAHSVDAHRKGMSSTASRKRAEQFYEMGNGGEMGSAEERDVPGNDAVEPNTRMLELIGKKASQEFAYEVQSDLLAMTEPGADSRPIYSVGDTYVQVFWDGTPATTDFGNRVQGTGQWEVVVKRNPEDRGGLLVGGQDVAREDFRFVELHRKGEIAAQAAEWIWRKLSQAHLDSLHTSAWNPGVEQLGDFMDAMYLNSDSDVDAYNDYRRTTMAQGGTPMTLNSWRKSQHDTKAASKEHTTMHTLASLHQRETDILAAMSHATLDEQQALSYELDDLRARRSSLIAHDREVNYAQAVVRAAVTPVATHTLHTASTDWLGKIALDDPDDRTLRNRMHSEATVWFTKLHEAIVAHDEEFVEQALGMARRVASGNVDRDRAENYFLEQAAHLRRVATGAPKVKNPNPAGTGSVETYDSTEHDHYSNGAETWSDGNPSLGRAADGKFASRRVAGEVPPEFKEHQKAKGGDGDGDGDKDEDDSKPPWLKDSRKLAYGPDVPVGTKRRVMLPFSEVCMHMQVAGKEMLTEYVGNGMVQLLRDDGSPFSFPITYGEAGWAQSENFVEASRRNAIGACPGTNKMVPGQFETTVKRLNGYDMRVSTEKVTCPECGQKVNAQPTTNDGGGAYILSHAWKDKDGKTKRQSAKDKYQVIQDPLNGNKWQVRKFYPDSQTWHDVGDPCDTREEAEAKMQRETTAARQVNANPKGDEWLFEASVYGKCYGCGAPTNDYDAYCPSCVAKQLDEAGLTGTCELCDCADPLAPSGQSASCDCACHKHASLRRRAAEGDAATDGTPIADDSGQATSPLPTPEHDRTPFDTLSGPAFTMKGETENPASAGPLNRGPNVPGGVSSYSTRRQAAKPAARVAGEGASLRSGHVSGDHNWGSWGCGTRPGQCSCKKFVSPNSVAASKTASFEPGTKVFVRVKGVGSDDYQSYDGVSGVVVADPPPTNGRIPVRLDIPSAMENGSIRFYPPEELEVDPASSMAAEDHFLYGSKTAAEELPTWTRVRFSRTVFGESGGTGTIADDSGQASSGLPQTPTLGNDDAAAFTEATGLYDGNVGTDAADVGSVPTPGSSEADYPQPKAGSLEAKRLAFRNLIQANLGR